MIVFNWVIAISWFFEIIRVAFTFLGLLCVWPLIKTEYHTGQNNLKDVYVALCLSQFKALPCHYLLHFMDRNDTDTPVSILGNSFTCPHWYKKASIQCFMPVYFKQNWFLPMSLQNYPAQKYNLTNTKNGYTGI